MLSPVFRKQFVTSIQQASQTQDILDVLEILLVLLQKFGKQLAQSPIRDFGQEHYAEAFALYELLGWIRLESQDVRDLQSALYDALGESVVRVESSQKSLSEDLAPKEILMSVGGQSHDPSLRVSSASKLYKRGLHSDLDKLLSVS